MDTLSGYRKLVSLSWLNGVVAYWLVGLLAVPTQAWQCQFDRAIALDRMQNNTGTHANMKSHAKKGYVSAKLPSSGLGCYHQTT